MIIKELLEKLKDYPEDTEVVYPSNNHPEAIEMIIGPLPRFPADDPVLFGVRYRKGEFAGKVVLV